MPAGDTQPRAPELADELAPGQLSQLLHDASVSELELSHDELTEQRANGVSMDSVELAERRPVGLAS